MDIKTNIVNSNYLSIFYPYKKVLLDYKTLPSSLSLSQSNFHILISKNLFESMTLFENIYSKFRTSSPKPPPLRFVVYSAPPTFPRTLPYFHILSFFNKDVSIYTSQRP